MILRKPKNSLLRILYPEWLKYKSAHTNAETYIMRIKATWNKHYRDSQIIKKPIIKLTKLELDEWAHALIKEYSMTIKEYYNATIIIRQCLDYAVDKEIIEINYFDKIKIDGKRLFRKVKKKPDCTQVFTNSEYEEIKKMAWNDFNNNVKNYALAALAILFQFQTELRIGELCVVRYSDIETDDYIHIQRMYRVKLLEEVEHTKTENGDREVFLSSEAKFLIESAMQRQKELGIFSDGGIIFSRDGKPITQRLIENLYKKYCERLGIENKTSHKARKTYISRLFDNKVNVNTIRAMVGHADERTTLGNYVYDRSTESEKKNRLESALTG